MLLNDLRWYTVGDARILKIQDLMLAALSPEQLLPDWDEATALQIYPRLPETLDSSEPDPKVFEQYQHVVIHPSLRRDGVNGGMDWYCPTRT